MKIRAMMVAGVVGLATLSSATAWGKVSASEAAKLGDTLTPVGAERAGNADGTIPAWEGGYTGTPAGFAPGNWVNPYADEKPLFVINQSNVEQYKDKLSAGQVAMIKKYGDFSIPVYPTHRSAAYPQKVYDAAKKNATTVDMVADGNGLTPFETAVPFPIPSGSNRDQALQVIWNHITRYRGGSVERTIAQATPLANGNFTPVKFHEEITWRDELTDYDPAKDPNVMFYFRQEIVAPARLAGNVLLVHETINQVKEPRRAWIYNQGQRRVRRAPQVAYDGPGTASDGLRTSDDFDMYNGAPDRYEWKLVGKKEMYIPYNSYKLMDKSLKYADIIKPGHMASDLTRYELHRVWVVEATLKSGMRHVYAKRVFHIDEDTWQAAVIDMYDGRGELWRVSEAHEVSFYDQKVPWYAVQAIYDLLSGRYLVLGLSNEAQDGYNFGIKRAYKDYTPAALRRAGRR